MIFDRAGKKSNGAAGQKRQAAGARLHSISAVLRERNFVGSFDVAGAGYEFTYVPSKAELSGEKLQLRGRLEITGPRGRARAKDNVAALLISAQGGVGTAPVRRQVLVGGVAESTAATSGQQQQIAGDKPAAATGKPDASDTAKTAPLPEVESTGPLSFCGAMYFQLESLNGREVGIAADLARVQLNVRLAPTDDSGRALHSLYSSAVDALYGNQSDTRMAAAVIGEINKLLAEG